MPGIGKQKIAIGYQVRPIKKTSTPRDIGDPAKARIDTLKWLKGEGPVPEHFSLQFPDDEEALEDYKKDLWVHPERAKADASAAYQFIAEAGDAEKDLLKSEQNRRQRATREQTQEAAFHGVLVRQKDSEKWRDVARKVLGRGGDETLLQIATRIQEELLVAGWVRKAEWNDLSKTDRLDPDTGYVPSVDVIVRFLRNLTKTQRQ